MELMPMAGLAAMGTAGIDRSNGLKIRPVDTIAALLEAPTSQPVWVRAFYVGMDSGGGHFWWDSNEDKQNHNGGTIIDPDHTASIGSEGWYSPENTGTGCWKRPNKGHINVRSFGAKGDGITDDTNAIQAAIDSLISINSKGQVRLPARSTPYRFTQIDLKGQQIGIVGDARDASILKLTDDASVSNAILQKEQGQFLKHLIIEGNRENVNSVDCIDALGGNFNGFGVYENVKINKFDGTGMKFQNSHMTTLTNVSIGRCKIGVYTERCKPLLFCGLDVGKWTEHAIHFEGTPSGQNLYGQGLFIEASRDEPVAGAAAIYINTMRSDLGDSIQINGMWMNGHNTTQGFDTTGIEINHPVYADNINIKGYMRQVETPFRFANVGPDEIGTVHFDEIRIDSDSGDVARNLGVISEDMFDFYAISEEIDLSMSGTREIIGFEEIGSIRIKKVDLRVLSETGLGPDTISIDFEFEGASSQIGTVDVPSEASTNTIVDVTDELTNLNFNNRTENRIVCSASGGGTGIVQIQMKATIYDQL